MSVERLTRFATFDGGVVYVDYENVVEVRSAGGEATGKAVLVLDNGSAHVTDVDVPWAYASLLEQKRLVEKSTSGDIASLRENSPRAAKSREGSND